MDVGGEMGTAFSPMRSRLQGRSEVRSGPTQFHSGQSQSAHDDILGPDARRLPSGIMGQIARAPS
eukprot:8596989-Pyramimonas_sp.AAC.2